MRFLLQLIAAITLALPGLSADVLTADVATTPTASARYKYDHAVAFAQATDRSTPRPAVSPASLTSGVEGAAASIGLGTRASVAAKAADDVVRLPTRESWGRLDTLADHFARHGADFGARTADEYASATGSGPECCGGGPGSPPGGESWSAPGCRDGLTDQR